MFPLSVGSLHLCVAAGGFVDNLDKTGCETKIMVFDACRNPMTSKASTKAPKKDHGAPDVSWNNANVSVKIGNTARLVAVFYLTGGCTRDNGNGGISRLRGSHDT